MASNSATSEDVKIENAGALDATEAPPPALPPVLAAQSKWYVLRQEGTALVRYLLDSEVHTFAFSVAANAILSFIPLVVLLYAMAFGVFKSTALVGVVSDMIYYFFPSNQEFIVRNLVAYAPHHGVQILSGVMILISCTGIFLPL